MNYKTINQMLEMTRNNISIKQIEKELDCGILHKLPSLLRRMYKGQLPSKIGQTEFYIILGELRKEELTYRDKIKFLKEGQISLKEFMR